MKPIGAIGCFIDRCEWWVPEPVEVSSGRDRDEITCAHISDEHTVQEVLEQINRLRIEVASPRMTREQVEDRNSIIYLLRAVIGLPPYE